MEIIGTRFQPHPQVLHQTVDGEAVLIHMETGTYYSLAGLPGWVWDRLVSGWTGEETARHLPTGSAGATGPVITEVEDLIRRLVAENLLVPAPAGFERTEGETGPVPAYGPLTFDKYTDMQDLLLADPIHEVKSGEGWPARPADPRG